MRINMASFHVYCLSGGVVIWDPTFLTVWSWKHERICPAAQSSTALRAYSFILGHSIPHLRRETHTVIGDTKN